MSQISDYRYFVSLKFKNGSKAYSFGTNDETIKYGDSLIVETSQGLELGDCISPLRNIELYTGQSELKPILRKASHNDKKDYEENIIKAKEAMKFCEEKIAELNLNMQLISAEYTLDRGKILFVYLADERVDFRELLKILAGDLKCRIELKQIGARDRAKLVGAVGVCGRECCCSSYKENFDIISINMAKNQLLALNIPKLSGQCGKLKCCLKFEDDDYKDVIDGLPKLNSKVEYNGKIYNVTSINPIKELIKIQNHEEVFDLTLDEIRTKAIIQKPMNLKKKKDCENCSCPNKGAN